MLGALILGQAYLPDQRTSCFGYTALHKQYNCYRFSYGNVFFYLNAYNLFKIFDVIVRTYDTNKKSVCPIGKIIGKETINKLDVLFKRNKSLDNYFTICMRESGVVDIVYHNYKLAFTPAQFLIICEVFMEAYDNFFLEFKDDEYKKLKNYKSLKDVLYGI